MNYIWEKALKEGQKAIGFVEVYTSEIKEKNVKAIINYLPQFPDSNDQKDAHITLFFEGQQTDITDGLFHWMYDDICCLGEGCSCEETVKVLLSRNCDSTAAQNRPTIIAVYTNSGKN